MSAFFFALFHWRKDTTSLSLCSLSLSLCLCLCLWLCGLLSLCRDKIVGTTENTFVVACIEHNEQSVYDVNTSAHPNQLKLFERWQMFLYFDPLYSRTWKKHIRYTRHSVWFSPSKVYYTLSICTFSLLVRFVYPCIARTEEKPATVLNERQFACWCVGVCECLAEHIWFLINSILIEAGCGCARWTYVKPISIATWRIASPSLIVIATQWNWATVSYKQGNRLKAITRKEMNHI